MGKKKEVDMCAGANEIVPDNSAITPSEPSFDVADYIERLDKTVQISEFVNTLPIEEQKELSQKLGFTTAEWQDQFMKVLVKTNDPLNNPFWFNEVLKQMYYGQPEYADFIKLIFKPGYLELNSDDLDGQPREYFDILNTAVFENQNEFDWQPSKQSSFILDPNSLKFDRVDKQGMTESLLKKAFLQYVDGLNEGIITPDRKPPVSN